jgi:hypothetical protein
MRNPVTLKTTGAAAAMALGLGLAGMSATPAAAQSYGDPLVDTILRTVLAASAQDSRYAYGQGTYRGENCQYYRDGRCYRNLGHWEREHGINSRDGSYGDRGRYQEGRTWRNHGEWRSSQNRRDREYRYDRRW